MRIDSVAIRRLGEALRARDTSSGQPPVGHGDPSDPSPEQRALMVRVAPMCEAMYLMMSADGCNDATERETLRGAIRELTDGALSGSDIDSMIERFGRAAEGLGRTERLTQVASQLASDREDAEAALALVAAVAMADGSVDPAERDTLDCLVEWLGVSSERAAIILGSD